MVFSNSSCASSSSRDIPLDATVKPVSGTPARRSALPSTAAAARLACSPVVTNLQGVALDGENTAGGKSTGAQLALPSGNGYPGGNFFDSFFINTTPPSVAAGTLKMAPASDTNIVGDNVTKSGTPTFDGTVSEANPALVPVVGQTAVLDIGIETVINGVPFGRPYQSPFAVR